MNILITGVLFAYLTAAPISAQESKASPDTMSDTYGSWTLRCTAGRSDCRVFQALYRKKDKARLVQATVFKSPGAEPALHLRVLSPLGAMLSKGAVLSIDDAAPQTIDFLACWRPGCVAKLRLTRRTEAALRDGKILAIRVVSADTNKAVRFELSLKGLSRALDQLQKK